jgi:hypothetical protein
MNKCATVSTCFLFIVLLAGCNQPGAGGGSLAKSAFTMKFGTAQSISKTSVASRVASARRTYMAPGSKGISEGGTALPDNYVEFRFGLNASRTSLWLGKSTDISSRDTVALSVYRSDLGPGVGAPDLNSELVDGDGKLIRVEAANSPYFLNIISSTTSTSISTTVVSGTLDEQYDEAILEIGSAICNDSNGCLEDIGPQFIVNNYNGITGHFGYDVIGSGNEYYADVPSSQSGNLTINGNAFMTLLDTSSGDVIANVYSGHYPDCSGFTSAGNIYIIFVPQSWLANGSALGIDTATSLLNFSNESTWIANPGIASILSANPSLTAENLFNLFAKFYAEGAIKNPSAAIDKAIMYELIAMPQIDFTSGTTVNLNVIFYPTVSGVTYASTSPVYPPDQFPINTTLDVQGTPPLNFSVSKKMD